LRVFVKGTVIGIVAALDASTRATGFDQLHVVLVAQANAVLGVSQSARTPARVVLTPCIIRVQPVKCFGTDTPCDCESDIGISHRSGDDGGGNVKGNSRWAKRPPPAPYPVWNSTFLQKLEGSSPC